MEHRRSKPTASEGAHPAEPGVFALPKIACGHNRQGYPDGGRQCLHALSAYYSQDGEFDDGVVKPMTPVPEMTLFELSA